LAAADAHLLHGAQVVAHQPKHHTDLQVVQSRHEMRSPCLLRASTMRRVSLVAAADSSCGQRSGLHPAARQPTKYSSSARKPSLSASASGRSSPSAVYSVGARPAELNSTVPPSATTVYSMENG